MTNPESAKVLAECAELQMKKARDYQNPNSTVQQADYYPNGVQSIHDTMHGKMLRIEICYGSYAWARLRSKL